MNLTLIWLCLPEAWFKLSLQRMIMTARRAMQEYKNHRIVSERRRYPIVRTLDQFVSRTRTTYETHTSDFILNTLWNGKPVQFFQERYWEVVPGCQENKSCSKDLNFLERLDDRIRCTHEETVAVVKPWEDIGSNKSLGCIFSEKPADWTNAFKIEISSLADFYDVLLHG